MIKNPVACPFVHVYRGWGQGEQDHGALDTQGRGGLKIKDLDELIEVLIVVA